MDVRRGPSKVPCFLSAIGSGKCFYFVDKGIDYSEVLFIKTFSTKSFIPDSNFSVLVVNLSTGEIDAFNETQRVVECEAHITITSA